MKTTSRRLAYKILYPVVRRLKTQHYTETPHWTKLLLCTTTTQGGKGHCAVYYTSPQSFLIRWLNNFRDFMIKFDWLVQ